jgi:secondary thiamine-phosphate synthase enzyme
MFKMTVKLMTFEIHSNPFCDLIDITNQVQDAVNNSDILNGIVNVHVAGSTAAISTIEFEPGLVKSDIKEFLENIIPYKREYKHHRTWGDHNGSSHVRSFLIKTSETFPFQEGKLILGTWQQIIFCEFDEKPRRRTIYCQIIGE